MGDFFENLYKYPVKSEIYIRNEFYSTQKRLLLLLSNDNETVLRHWVENKKEDIKIKNIKQLAYIFYGILEEKKDYLITSDDLSRNLKHIHEKLSRDIYIHEDELMLYLSIGMVRSLGKRKHDNINRTVFLMGLEVVSIDGLGSFVFFKEYKQIENFYKTLYKKSVILDNEDIKGFFNKKTIHKE